MPEEKEIEKLYHRLALNLRSATHGPTNGEDCKCLVRFHNCTPYNVQPFWIDVKGRPIKYRPLQRGASMNMDTYESHLWFFKALDRNDANKGTNSDMIKLLAIPEEILKVDGGFPQLNKYFKDPTSGSPDVRDTTLDMNNVLICSLCKYVAKNYFKDPMKVPCPHFTGEAKFSVSDTVCRSSFNSTYIYECTTRTHRQDHSNRRRDIYLVEPFYNLRERCFLALKNYRHSDLTEMPESLQEDYLQFLTILIKVNESSVNQ